MLVIRAAVEDDVAQIYSWDPIVQEDAGRREYIRRSVVAGACHVAVVEDRVAGYAVFDHTFFEQGFVALLYIAPSHRRQGLGRALMLYLEAVCETRKLFTSTNLSNHPMHSLLAQIGYKLSGVIHDLDEGDPELIFVKYL